MATGLKLYEIAAEHSRIFDAIEANDGELTPELEAALDASSESLAAKLDACCRRLRNLALSQAEAHGRVVGIQAELDRAQAREDDITAEAKRLESYIQRCVEGSGETRVDTPLFSVRVQENQPSAQWLGTADEIPEAFRRVKTVVEFDKSMAVSAYKAGVELPEGVHISRKKKLVIK